MLSPRMLLLIAAFGLLAAPSLPLLPAAVAAHTEPYNLEPIELIFGGSARQAQTRVLLIPPTHGDLGNPFGPAGSATGYLDATLRGIHKWEPVFAAFAADYPQYSYLTQITVDVEIWDGVTPIVGPLYDVIIGYVETAGGVFRGVAADCADPPRCIGLALNANSPRAHQNIPDYPELTDLETVTMHEFAHTWGLGHTLTRIQNSANPLGYDLMNSPATFVYGDGSAVGDGGERTPLFCISSLDLYGMAYLYRWLPSGTWVGSSGWLSLPSDIPYELYC